LGIFKFIFPIFSLIDYSQYMAQEADFRLWDELYVKNCLQAKRYLFTRF